MDRYHDKEKMLTTAAYGVHRAIEKKIDGLMSELGIQTYFFYEYFLCSPILKNTVDKEKLNVIAPFLTRIVSNLHFIPKIIDRKGQNQFNEKLELNDLVQKVKELLSPVENLEDCKEMSHQLWEVPIYPKSDEIIDKSWRDNFVPEVSGKSMILKLLIEYWVKDSLSNINLEDKKKVYKYLILQDEKNPNRLENCFHRKNNTIIFNGALRPNFYRNGDFLCNLKELANDNLEGSLGLLKEFLITVKPWISKEEPKEEESKEGKIEIEDRTAYTIALSISSEKIFWGEIIIILPAEELNIILKKNDSGVWVAQNKENDNSEKVIKSKEKLDKVIEDIKKEIEKLYLPMLTLFENYWCEKLLDDNFDLNWNKNIREGIINDK